MESGDLKNKKILVTGAGSIGSAIVDKVLQYDIHSVRILDNSEIKLHNLKQKYKHLGDKVKYLFGDIRDVERLYLAMRDIDIVFHTAAMKHVSFCEENPIDAIKSNVLGTQNIIDVAIKRKCEKVVNISTDKAVDPSNVMGATKLLTERLIKCADIYKGDIETNFISIRFGNVIASSGSVIEIFANQIKKNKSITITDPNMIRYMMSIDDAIDLIFKAIKISKGSEIFILKMPKLKIMDLAKAMIGDKEIEIKYIGKLKEEKIDESLISNNEIEYTYENRDLYVIIDNNIKEYYELIGFKKVNKIQEYVLNIKEIKEILKNDKNIYNITHI